MGVLITGATGLIGSKITEFCQERGISGNFLTTSKSKLGTINGFKGFYWNPEEKEIDAACLKGVRRIINLAGASLARPWTRKYKAEIVSSRTDSLNLLFETLKNQDHQISHLVSASAIGAYPSSFDKIYDEDSQMDNSSFLGKLVQDWEYSADRFSELGIDVAKIRIGLVLAKNGGALPIFKRFIDNYLGSPLGNGKQWQSWVHIDDIANIFVFGIEQNLDGVYNAVAPNPVTNKELVNAVALQLQKPIWLPNVPKVALKAVMGEMGQLAVSSHLVQAKKIQEMGFHFSYSNIHKACEDLL